ncbi:secondary thiamine-phosphate synthase enzyme YjbQ [Wukongibacter baidiensis]|uniref:secondary thiamine-phosphate synthase enzyme YjbQ n=1 Tax=Wukongibacter baidiensis TaxID=1723361 RepID=UPI003D7F72C0
MIKHFNVQTNKQTEFIEITNQIKQAIRESGVTEGVCYIFIPHTTAAVTINENADPDVKSDMVMELNKIVPLDDNYKHFEGNSEAHIKSSLMGFSEIILIDGGKPVLGTWQGIYFCEFDGPRNRKVMVRVQ